jgi:hypothetical protein
VLAGAMQGAENVALSGRICRGVIVGGEPDGAEAGKERSGPARAGGGPLPTSQRKRRHRQSAGGRLVEQIRETNSGHLQPAFGITERGAEVRVADEIAGR